MTTVRLSMRTLISWSGFLARALKASSKAGDSLRTWRMASGA